MMKMNRTLRENRRALLSASRYDCSAIARPQRRKKNKNKNKSDFNSVGHLPRVKGHI